MLPHHTDSDPFPSIPPSDRLVGCRKKWGRLPTMAPPHTVVFCYEKKALQDFLSLKPYQVCDGCFPNLYFLKESPGVAVGYFGIGAPVIASKTEELIAWGVEKFISVGTAGSLQAKIQPGDLVICDRAVRDETTSKQFIPFAKYIHAPRRMNNKLQAALKKMERNFHIGSSWTTDSFYKQSPEEISLYQTEGVLTVDREAAALFAVSHFYQVDLGVLFTISDFHENALWQAKGEDPLTKKNLHEALALSLLIAQE